MAQNISIVTSYDQALYLQAHRPDVLVDSLCVAVAPLAAIELAANGFSPLLASSLIPAERIRRIDDVAYELSRSWYKPFNGAFMVNGVHLGELTALDNLMFFKQALGAQEIAHQLFHRYPGTKISLYGSLERACADGSAFKDEHDVFEALFLWRAAQANASVTLTRFENKKTVPPPGPPSSQATKPLRMVAHSFRRKKGGGRFAIAFGNNWDLLRHDPLLRVLEEKRDFQTLLLNLEQVLDVSTSRTGGEAKELTYVSLQDYSSPSDSAELDIDREKLRGARRIFDNHIFSGELELLNCPHLKFQYDYMWDKWFKDIVKYRRIFEVMLADLEPDLVVCDEHSHYLYRLLSYIAKFKGIATVTTPHGNAIHYPHYFDFNSDRLFCSGRVIKDITVKVLGKDPGAIEVVGDINLRSVKEKFTRKKAERKTIFWIDQRYINYTICPMNLDGYLSAWQDVIDYVKNHSDVDLLLKPHPSYGYRDWQVEMVDRLGLDNFKIIEKERVSDVLARADISLMVGRISNAGIESILMDVPLVFFDKSTRVHNVGDMIWKKKHGLTVVKSREALAGVLDGLLTDHALFKQTVERQKKVIQEFFPGIIDGVEERIAMGIDHLLEKSMENYVSV